MEELESRILLSSTPARLLIPLPNMDGNDVTLQRDGSDIRLFDTASGATLVRQALVDTSEMVVQGVEGANDQLRIDYGGGTLGIPVTFHGGAAGHDTLTLQGGQFQTSRYDATGPDAGTITLDSEVVHYTGLEPVTDTTLVADRVFDLTTLNLSGTQQVRITDDGDPGNGLFTIDSNGTGTFESHTFAAPTGSLTIITPNSDTTIYLNSLDPAVQVPVSIQGGDGDDIFTANASGSGNIILNGGQGADTFTANASGQNTRLQLTANGNAGMDTFNVTTAAGAGHTTILGGAGSNTLTVESPNVAGVTGTINGNRVELIDGQQVLQYAGVQNNTLSQTGTIPTGLQGASDIAVTSDGRFIYVVGKYDDSITVFRRGAPGSQLEYIQTIRQNPSTTALRGSDVAANWTAAVSASNPLNWYQLDEQRNFEPALQTMNVGNFLYVLNPPPSGGQKGSWRVYGRDAAGHFTVLLQAGNTLGNPVAFDIDTTHNVVYVLSHTGNDPWLTSYTRDVTTGLMSFEAQVSAKASGPATGLQVSADHTIQIIGTDRHAYTFTRNATFHKLTLSSSRDLSPLDRGVLVTAVVAMDVGISSGYSGNIYYGTDAGLEVYSGNTRTAAFVFSGIRDVLTVPIPFAGDVVAVSRPNELRLYKYEFNTWSLLTTLTGANPQKLAQVRTTNGNRDNVIYATTSAGGITAYSVGIINDLGYSAAATPQRGLAASVFTYGQPTSLSVSADGRRLYAVTGNEAVIYVLNIDSFGFLSLGQVLGNVAVNRGSEQRNGLYQQNVSLGQLGLLGGAADFNGTAGFLKMGGADSNALAGFERDLVASTLLFSQALRDGSAGNAGLRQPNSLAVTPDGSTLFVGSSAGSGASHGGVARYTNLAFAGVVPSPTHNLTNFANIDQLTLTNWSDGQTSTTTGDASSASHTYTRSGTYTITATVTSADGTFAAVESVAVRVANVPPVLAIDGPTAVNEGRFVLTLAAAGDPLNYWTINWGDGGPSQIIPGNRTNVTHVFNGPGTYTITATGTDDEGTYPANSLTVNIANLTPVIQNVSTVEPFAQEGSPVTLVVSAYDAGGDTLTYAFDFDSDGVFDATSSTGQVQHTLTDGGIYPVRIRVSDGDGAAETIYTLTVRDVAPTLTLTSTPGSTVLVGEPLHLHLMFTGPGIEPIQSYRINWGDGTIHDYIVARPRTPGTAGEGQAKAEARVRAKARARPRRRPGQGGGDPAFNGMYDFVVAVGGFNVAVPDHESYFEKVVAKMWQLSRKCVAFNVLSGTWWGEQDRYPSVLLVVLPWAFGH